jgi:hypothetical protein
MRIILIPLLLAVAVVIAMMLLAAHGRSPRPTGPTLTMGAVLP